MSEQVIFEVFKQFGAPVGFLILFLVFGKKLSTWALDNVVTPLVRAHVEFLTETKESIKVMSENLGEMKNLLAETRKELAGLREKIDDQKQVQLVARIQALEAAIQAKEG